ncbi:MAG: hypothetical protein M1591_08960 [Deltaproteobacteria bacterium]|nr:hypothetical protein [Deltaproteobacteria bacterium]
MKKIFKGLAVFEIILAAVAIIGGIVIWGGDHSVSSKNIPSDKVLFSNFYKILLVKVSDADNTFASFDSARTKGNQLKAAKIALNIKDQMRERWNDIDTLELPKLQNLKASKDLKTLKDFISACYLYKQMMVEDYLNAVKNPNTYTVAKFQNDTEKSDKYLLAGTAEVLQVCTDLSMTDAEIKNMENESKQIPALN